MTEAATSTQMDIGALEDFEHGCTRLVAFQERELAVVRWGDEVFAVRNVCPHQTERFSGGRAHLRVSCGDELGKLEVVADRPVIACPRHLWTFDLQSGRCTVDPMLRIRTYDVQVVDGRVLLQVARRPVAAAESSPSAA